MSDTLSETPAPQTDFRVRLFWILLLGGVSLLLIGPLLFWWREGPLVVGGGKSGTALLLTALFSGVIWHRRIFHSSPPLTFASLTLLLFFFSNWHLHGYNLIQGPIYRGEILLFAIVGYGLAQLYGQRSAPIRILLILSMTLLSALFFIASQGRLVFSDDNPTFLYRIILLSKSFPNIPFYNPFWNGGIEARDFFATGALNVFALVSPLLVFFSAEDIFRIIHPALLFGFLPFCLYFAARLFDLPKSSAFFAALAGIAANITWYRWALQYGTLGFVTSTALVPLVAGFAYRFIKKDSEVSFPLLLGALVATTLMLFWSPTGLVFVPLFLLALPLLPALLKKKAFIPFVLLLVALNLPWISIFWSVSRVNTFLQADSPSFQQKAEITQELQTFEDITSEVKPLSGNKQKAFKFKKEPITAHTVLRILREAAIPTNPLVFTLGIAGIAFLPGLGRLLYGAIAIWLVALGSGLALLKPQLELDRMLVILTLFLAVPTGACLGAMWERVASYKVRLCFAFAFGYLLTGIFAVGGVLLSRTTMPIYFEPPEVQELVTGVRSHAGTGRVLFSGMVLHDFGNGHIAPLPAWTNVPAVASSPVHNLWQYTQVFPKEFLLDGDSGIDRYLELHNISLVAAHESNWRDYFLKRTEAFELIEKGVHFWLFKNKNFPSSYILSGSGELLEQNVDHILVRIDGNDAVLRFNYFDFLESSGCEISPFSVSQTSTFIALSQCTPGEVVEIRAKGAFERLLKRGREQ